jgi:general secretion pathway protein G
MRARDGSRPLISVLHLCGGWRAGLSLRRQVFFFADCNGNQTARKDAFALPSSAQRNERHRDRKSRGFTVVELLIVVAVLLTICAIAVPNLMAAMEQARIARAIVEIRTFEDDIALYNSIYGQLPDDLSQIGYASYLDPWGNPYQYLNHATMKGNGQARKDRFLVPLNSDYDLYSMGPDGKSSSPITAKNSQDDIIRASDGSFIGIASQF